MEVDSSIERLAAATARSPPNLMMSSRGEASCTHASDFVSHMHMWYGDWEACTLEVQHAPLAHA